MYGCSKLAKKITEESEENYINKLTKEKEKCVCVCVSQAKKKSIIYTTKLERLCIENYLRNWIYNGSRHNSSSTTKGTPSRRLQGMITKRDP